MLVATTFVTFLWSLIVIFFMVAYFILLVQVVGDLLRRHDASGGKKALWVIFLVAFPYLGLLAYYLANGGGMAQRAERSSRVAEQELGAYLRELTGSAGPADQIERAKALLDRGTISQEEFDKLKAKALA
jgi:ABC-type multidrug transport system fused ATPase/permease subunit